MHRQRPESHVTSKLGDCEISFEINNPIHLNFKTVQ